MDPSLTIGVDFDTGRLIGEIDGQQAMGQAVQLALTTPRWRYPTFSANYGSEIESLFGKHRDLVQGEIARFITEALSQDERIQSVDGFEMTFSGDEVQVGFTVHTIYGDLERRETIGIR